MVRSCILVLGHRLAVDQQYPVEIAAGSFLSPSDRSENDQVRIRSALLTEQLVKIVARFLSSFRGRPYG